jgi:hypothetical protein
VALAAAVRVARRAGAGARPVMVVAAVQSLDVEGRATVPARFDRPVLLLLLLVVLPVALPSWYSYHTGTASREPCGGW